LKCTWTLKIAIGSTVTTKYAFMTEVRGDGKGDKGEGKEARRITEGKKNSKDSDTTGAPIPGHSGTFPKYGAEGTLTSMPPSKKLLLVVLICA